MSQSYVSLHYLKVCRQENVNYYDLIKISKEVIPVFTAQRCLRAIEKERIEHDIQYRNKEVVNAYKEMLNN